MQHECNTHIFNRIGIWINIQIHVQQATDCQWILKEFLYQFQMTLIYMTLIICYNLQEKETYLHMTTYLHIRLLSVLDWWHHQKSTINKLHQPILSSEIVTLIVTLLATLWKHCIKFSTPSTWHIIYGSLRLWGLSNTVTTIYLGTLHIIYVELPSSLRRWLIRKLTIILTTF